MCWSFQEKKKNKDTAGVFFTLRRSLTAVASTIYIRGLWFFFLLIYLSFASFSHFHQRASAIRVSRMPCGMPMFAQTYFNIWNILEYSSWKFCFSIRPSTTICWNMSTRFFGRDWFVFDAHPTHLFAPAAPPSHIFSCPLAFCEIVCFSQISLEFNEFQCVCACIR